MKMAMKLILKKFVMQCEKKEKSALTEKK